MITTHSAHKATTQRREFISLFQVLYAFLDLFVLYSLNCFCYSNLPHSENRATHFSFHRPTDLSFSFLSLSSFSIGLSLSISMSLSLLLCVGLRSRTRATCVLFSFHSLIRFLVCSPSFECESRAKSVPFHWIENRPS